MSAQSFEAIYKYNLWITGSGTGSIYWNNKPYIKFLENIIKNYNIKSIIELGCGDCKLWENIKFDGEFIGIDIVDNKISPTHKFYNRYRKFNLLKDNPQKLNLNNSVDLLIIKDLFVHLSNKNMEDILRKIDRLNAKYLLLAEDSHYLIKSGAFPNQLNIKDGLYRPININLDLLKLESSNYYEITYLLWINFWIALFFTFLIKKNYIFANLVSVIILLWIPKKELLLYRLS